MKRHGNQRRRIRPLSRSDRQRLRLIRRAGGDDYSVIAGRIVQLQDDLLAAVLYATEINPMAWIAVEQIALRIATDAATIRARIDLRLSHRS